MSEATITIRLLEARDIPACVRLYQEAYAAPPYGDGWSDATCERIIRDLLRLFPQECFVAERASNLEESVGVASCATGPADFPGSGSAGPVARDADILDATPPDSGFSCRPQTNQEHACERTGEVLGFILCSSLAGLRATVEEFAVRPCHQQQGVGRKLLDHVVSRYRAQGLPFLELVANVNAPAFGFYSREGFEETGNYRLMSKQL